MVDGLPSHSIEGRTSSMVGLTPQRSNLLQGTLDMLILRTLLYGPAHGHRSEEHTSELHSPDHLVCRLLLEKKNHLVQGRGCVTSGGASCTYPTSNMFPPRVT